jgi:archaemetzincin
MVGVRSCTNAFPFRALVQDLTPWLLLLTLGCRAESTTAHRPTPLLTPPASVTPFVTRRFYIQPLGDAALEPDIAYARQALGAFYAGEVLVLPRQPMPPIAFYRPRNRQRADILLDWLRVRRPHDGFRLIGVTALDISTTKPPHRDWGVMGLADLSGTVCVLSSFRCRLRSTGLEHARIRFGKVIVHEVGHTLGLPHCSTVGCLMEDAQGTVLTTDREYDLCPSCRAALRAAGHGLAEGPIPWPRP